MELRDKLFKPYSDLERMTFIVKNNHKRGYTITETNEAIEAWGYTQEELEQKEKERIGELQITKRVFALALQQLGVTYTQLKQLIATSEQAQLEWDLCVELQRKNPLLDIMGAQMGITPEQLDYIFRKANGEEVLPPNQPTESEGEE